MIEIRKAVLTYNEYYFYNTDTKELIDDQELADMLGVCIDTCREFLQEHNGVFRRDMCITRFKSKEDANKALNSILNECF